MKKLILLMALPCLLMSEVFGATMWGVTGSGVGSGYKYRSEVFTVDTETLAYNKLTTTSLGWLYGDIAVTPSGNVYTVGVAKGGQWSRSIMRLDNTNGTVQSYWKDVLPVDLNALTAISDTKLLGVKGGYSGQHADLVEITLDGSGNYVSTSIIGRIDTQSNSGGDITFYKGAFIAATDNGTDIWSIPLSGANPLPGSATKLVEVNGRNIAGLAFDADDTEKLFAGRYDSKKLFVLDAASGDLTQVLYPCKLCYNIFGLDIAPSEPIPEPATMIFLGGGMLLVTLRKKV